MFSAMFISPGAEESIFLGYSFDKILNQIEDKNLHVNTLDFEILMISSVLLKIEKKCFYIIEGL